MSRLDTFNPKTSEEIISWGFDLTRFKDAETWKKVLLENNINPDNWKIEKRGGYQVYTWWNSDVKIVTGNNPITGEYSQPKRREKEIGYASYIGIRGKKSAVNKLVSSIKKHTDDIKDESPHKLDFIS